MIRGITEVNFPSYATLSQATVSLEEMGSRTITAQVKIDGGITPDFESKEWKLVYNGEEFILNTKTPQATKDTSTQKSILDLVFVSSMESELKRYFFIELSEVELGTVIIDKYIASLRLNVTDFITAFNRVLEYYFGANKFRIVAAPGVTLSPEVKDVSIEYTYLWDVLPVFYDVYGLTWHFTKDVNGYTITVGGEMQTIQDHVFQYGYQGGLTRIERQIEDADIYNQLLGRGGDKNLPYRYFKKADPNNTAFAGDPDACAELSTVYFERLLDINFRYYVKGWLRNPNRPTNANYPVPTTTEPEEVTSTWAYQKGLTDEKFRPVEYVKDDESIAKYGVRQGKLDDNDEIYPTIQGVTVSPYGRIDEIVAVGSITDGSDGVDTGGDGTKKVSLPDMLADLTSTKSFSDNRNVTDFVTIEGTSFSVPAGFVGQIDYVPYVERQNSRDFVFVYEPKETDVFAVRDSDGALFGITSIPGGESYHLKVKFVVSIGAAHRGQSSTTREVGFKNITLTSSVKASASSDTALTFNVWIKNVFQTTQGTDETDLQYMKRVWEPILGDRVGNEAKLVFSDGWMSASSDYEFTIVDWPTVDRSKTIDGVSSEWMLTLAKSDVDYEATGKYLPNATSPKPVGGDHFFFIGIDMPHIYVEWAEKKLNAEKQTALESKAYANPTWTVQLDKIRINTLEGKETATLMSRLGTGVVMQIYDKRFSGGQILFLAIRTITITWASDTVMLPNVDVVLSENVLARSSGSSTLSPENIIASLESTVNKIQQQNAMMPMVYLSKEKDDVAVGHITMQQGSSFGNYAGGLAGFGGNIDAKGRGELDELTIRHFLEVPELRYNRISVQIGNRWNAPGGGIIERVEPDYDTDGNILNTGIIYLHLEDGEIGMVTLDDICMGIYHDGITADTNALADTDDGIGNFHFSGFYTTYFRVTEILAGDNHAFRYSIRPVSDTWKETHHPCEAMHFVGYGNFSDTTRQTSRYSTRTYERYLKGVNSWEFTKDNIGAQFGDLSNLSVFSLNMTGYSAYLNNIYMSGVIQQFQDIPYRMEIDTGGQDTLAYGESITVKCSVFHGWDDKTSEVTSWSIVRDTGDTAADAAWSELDKVKNFAGTITIAHGKDYSDLATVGLSTLFTITATLSDGTSTQLELTV